MREALDFASMEQKELAKKTGLSLKTIENYVKKESSIPSADKAFLIAQSLGVSVEYLVTGKNEYLNIENPKKPKDKELYNTLSMLNSNNYEIITSMAKLLLNFQIINKSSKK